MSRYRCSMPLVCAGALLMAVSAVAQPAATAPITLRGPGPYYRLTLPLSIHSRAAHADLRDLRVRNGAGQAVPYAWLRNEAAAPRTASRNVPIFALPGIDASAASGDAALAFTVRPDGSLALEGKAAKRKASDAAEWLIDLSQVKGSLLQARFDIAPDARGLFAFRLEASDDLRRWRPVGGEEQLVRLAHGGQTLERLAVDLGNLRTRFLRLRWSDPQHGVALTGVGIDSVQEVEPVAPLEWSAALKPERCAVDYCDYLLPRGLPVQSLRIDLADVNTLAQVAVSGLSDPAAASSAAAVPQRPVPLNTLYALRHRQRPPAQRPALADETPLVDTVVYRLAQAGGEARSPVLALDGAVHARLRLRTSGPVSVLGATPPTIAVGAVPRTLVFLAQGAAPFALAWRSAPEAAGVVDNAEPGEPLALSTLIPGYAADKPVVADDASVALPLMSVAAAVAPAPAAQAAPAKEPSRKWWLWGALGAGLLLLAGMAWSLFASLRKQNDAPAAD